MNELQKIVEMSPAFDRRQKDPSRNYGIHGMELRFILKGDRGAVQFVIYTNWRLPHVCKELMTKHLAAPDRIGAECSFLPMPADLGYHSPSPRYDGQFQVEESCRCLDGKPCYYDGSSLNAQRIFDVMVAQGDEGMWRELHEYYDSVFGAESATAGVL